MESYSGNAGADTPQLYKAVFDAEPWCRPAVAVTRPDYAGRVGCENAAGRWRLAEACLDQAAGG